MDLKGHGLTEQLVPRPPFVCGLANWGEEGWEW